MHEDGLRRARSGSRNQAPMLGAKGRPSESLGGMELGSQAVGTQWVATGRTGSRGKGSVDSVPTESSDGTARLETGPKGWAAFFADRKDIV